jgi:lipopolysaccharide export system protein LptC
LRGDVAVSSEHIDTNKLTVIDASSANVNLNGQMDIGRIYANQSSHLSMTWVDSPSLVLYANDHAHVKLAGVAKEFYIHLADNALLDAQYLRANSVTISSNDSSQARLMPLFSFQGFAHQNSTVYLYHQPLHQNKHTWEGANIFMKSYRP